MLGAVIGFRHFSVGEGGGARMVITVMLALTSFNPVVIKPLPQVTLVRGSGVGSAVTWFMYNCGVRVFIVKTTSITTTRQGFVVLLLMP